MAAADLGAAEWERSKIFSQDINMLKKLGISKKSKALCFPSEESYPTPPMGYRVCFVDHLIRGLSAPIHPFLRGLLFVYGLQLHHLTPNSILHISIFITLCEAFLGVQPNWALWKRIFFCRRNGSPNVAYNIGGVVISVRTDYFDVKLPDSVQGWRKKWLYIQEENLDAEDNIPPLMAPKNLSPFLGRGGHRRREGVDRNLDHSYPRVAKYSRPRIIGSQTSSLEICWRRRRRSAVGEFGGQGFRKTCPKNSSLSKRDAVPSSCRVTPFSAANPLPKPMIKELVRIGSQFIGYREYASRTEEKLAEANRLTDTLAQKLEQSEKARQKAELDASQAKVEADEAKAKAASVEELQKKLEDAEAALNEHKAAQAAREKGILKRVNTQNRRFLGQTSQDFDLENPTNDPLLDTLSYLEFHGHEIREGVVNADAGLSKLFPYFFPKKEEPKTFLALAKDFNPPEDLGLKMRQKT
ncbi:hypothetical protein QYE76_015108 [Lolium multiflorum]|uniref:Transposase (putative) gypsy type domain-containing protein n=1 Tax=Lolium multiflorum TaxID=4521 RepID=A0AAD8U3S2_LOLMU|nr:hypothetical protein QYE76_015108 [Lolium multiflorum]